MLQPSLSALALLAIGLFLWRRRRPWRHRPDHVLTLSVILQCIAFMLCAPVTHSYLGAVLFAVTGIANLTLYFGSVAFIAAACAVTYAVAYRLLPDEDLPHFIRRIDWVAAGAAVAMLITITYSHISRVRRAPVDFFVQPTDAWMKAYWVVYGACIIYLLGYLIRLSWELRHEPRSQVSAHLFILASSAGIIGIVVIVANSLFSLHIVSPELWTLVSIPSVLVGCAAIWRWTIQLRTRAKAQLR